MKPKRRQTRTPLLLGSRPCFVIGHGGIGRLERGELAPETGGVLFCGYICGCVPGGQREGGWVGSSGLHTPNLVHESFIAATSRGVEACAPVMCRAMPAERSTALVSRSWSRPAGARRRRACGSCLRSRRPRACCSPRAP